MYGDDTSEDRVMSPLMKLDLHPPPAHQDDQNTRNSLQGADGRTKARDAGRGSAMGTDAPVAPLAG